MKLKTKLNLMSPATDVHVETNKYGYRGRVVDVLKLLTTDELESEIGEVYYLGQFRGIRYYDIILKEVSRNI